MEKEEIILNKKEIEIALILMKYSFEEISEVYHKISIKVAKNLMTEEQEE